MIRNFAVVRSLSSSLSRPPSPKALAVASSFDSEILRSLDTMTYHRSLLGHACTIRVCRRPYHGSVAYRATSTDDVHVTIESGSRNAAQSKQSTTLNDESSGDDSISSGSACSQGIPDLEEEEEEQEEMFVTADPVLGLGKVQEWGGPTRGGRLAEPTRFGDWERKGRCTDF